MRTGKENKITVQNAGGLSKEEIEQMKRDAETHAAEDKKRREVIDLKNQGENLAYSTEKMLKEQGEKVSPDVRGQIEGAINNLRDALKSDDGDRIKKTLDNLRHAVAKTRRRDVQERRRRSRRTHRSRQRPRHRRPHARRRRTQER